VAYFGGSSRMAGDPGFFGSLARTFGKVATFIPGPIGAIARTVQRTRSTPPRAAPVGAVFSPPSRQMFVPPATAGRIRQAAQFTATGMPRKRRRMNAANPRALRRAIRRTDAFVGMAKSALKNTGFKIVSKSSGKLTEAAWQKKQHHRK